MTDTSRIDTKPTGRPGHAWHFQCWAPDHEEPPPAVDADGAYYFSDDAASAAEEFAQSYYDNGDSETTRNFPLRVITWRRMDGETREHIVEIYFSPTFTAKLP